VSKWRGLGKCLDLSDFHFQIIFLLKFLGLGLGLVRCATSGGSVGIFDMAHLPIWEGCYGNYLLSLISYLLSLISYLLSPHGLISYLHMLLSLISIWFLLSLAWHLIRNVYIRSWGDSVKP
jgi:hypothetical protein